LASVDLEILLPAFLAGLLVLSTHVPLGQLVLERGIVFIDLAIAQVAGLGVVAADAMGWEPKRLVDRQDPGAFLREPQRGCTTIADALAWALPGPDDHSDLAFEPHGYILSTACRRMPPGCRFGKTA
jgi:hypothetical protein